MEIWLASQMGDDASCAYNEPFMVQLNGLCDLNGLRQAIQTILARHEALHLRFSPDGGYQQKTTPRPIEIPFQDFAELETEVKEARLQEILAAAAATPFDLTHGPLVRVQILRLAEEQHLIVFSCHHIVCDGWSWNHMLQEIGQVYTALSKGTPYRLPRTFSYSNFVVAEMQRQTTDAVKASYDYWLTQFAELPPALDLPTDYTRPPVKSYKGGTVTYHFKSDVYDAIKHTAAEQRASLFSILFASFNLLLARLSGQTDVVMTVPAAGQLMVGETSLVGHCVNLLPIRTKLEMDVTFSELLTATTTKILDAYDHQESTLGGIIKRLDMPRDISRIPLAEVNFNVDRDDAGVKFGNLDVSIAQTPKEAVIFDIFSTSMKPAMD
ncbi:hypothetical protein KFU94_61085 [Chloroflexi bacterium TSY]|nr:hypothetical protein [Chloroflexi bacterium TSY]